MIRHRVFFAGFLTLLASCGGGGSDAPSCPAVTIALFGDSTMGGSAVLTQIAFDASAPGRVAIENRSISGTGSGDLIQSWPNGAFDFAVALDNHGINDCIFATATVETFKANLHTLVKKGVTILETSNPITLQDCSAYPQATREVAAELRLPLVDTEAFVAAIPNWQTHLVDQVHPDPWLFQQIATNRARAMTLVMAPLVCPTKP